MGSCSGCIDLCVMIVGVGVSIHFEFWPNPLLAFMWYVLGDHISVGGSRFLGSKLEELWHMLLTTRTVWIVRSESCVGCIFRCQVSCLCLILDNSPLCSHTFVYFSCRPEPSNEFYDGDHDNDKESDVEIWSVEIRSTFGLCAHFLDGGTWRKWQGPIRSPCSSHLWL